MASRTMPASTYLTLFVVVVLARADMDFTINENVPKDFTIGQVLGKSGLLGRYNSTVIESLQYTLMSRGSLPTDYFQIDRDTSQLRVAKPIDRDNLCDLLRICCGEVCRISLSIAVQPTKGAFFVETLMVKVNIRDQNDNPPKFPLRVVEGHISEIADVGTTVVMPSDGNYLIATDSDLVQNGVKNYSIICPGGEFGLILERSFGTITDVAIVSLKELDREKVSAYDVVIVAHDGGVPSLSGSVRVKINVDDFNDHDPEFLNKTYNAWLSEDVPVGTSVIRVEAKDKDIGSNGAINYSVRNLPSDVVSRLFTIDSSTGEIRTKNRLNYEEQSTYHIIVQASDEGATVRRKSRAAVVVNLIDVNDHGPLIKLSYLSKNDRAEIREDAKVRTFVAYIIVQDPDKDSVSCAIDSPMFRIIRSNPRNPNEYHLVTAHRLNRELADEYRVTLTCTDRGTPPLQSVETFSVYILDSNDNTPTFTQSTYTASVMENNQLDIFLLEVMASDADIGENARIIYSLDDEGDKNFSINSASGRIYTKRSFNREEYDQLHFKVLARDNGTSPLFAEANVIIRIADDNDNAPTFHNPRKFEISEAAGPGVLLGQMSASDPDIGRNARIHFELQHGHDSQSFTINHEGVLTTLVQLDREHRDKYELVILAKDDGRDVVHSSSATVTIVVTDVNDNAPVIHFPSTYNNTVYISYLEPVGHTVTQVNATDADDGRNAFLDFSFTQGNEDKLFRINQNTGAVYVSREMQQQDAGVFKLGIRVMDRAEPYNSNVEVLNIVIDGTGKAISTFGTYLDSIASNKNLIIVICLAGVSAVLAIILVVAIVCIRKTDREQHQYSVTAETQKMYDKRADPKEQIAETKYVQPVNQRAPVGYSTEVDDSPLHHGHANHNPTSINGHHLHNSPIYSSLRPANTWKSSVYPKVAEV